MFLLEYLFSDCDARLELGNKTCKKAGANELYYAGMLLWLVHKNEGPDRALKIFPGSREVVYKQYFIPSETEVLTRYKVK